MRIIKCDLCRKQIKQKELEIAVTIAHPFSSQSFCEICGKDIIKFLKRHDLMNNNKKTE